MDTSREDLDVRKGAIGTPEAADLGHYKLRAAALSTWRDPSKI